MLNSLIGLRLVSIDNDKIVLKDVRGGRDYTATFRCDFDPWEVAEVKATLMQVLDLDINTVRRLRSLVATFVSKKILRRGKEDFVWR